MEMLTINVSELILTIVNFFLLLFLLKRFLYTPIVTFMDERRARIENGLALEKDALAAVSEKEHMMASQRKESRQEATAILASAQSADRDRHAQCVLKAQEQAALSGKQSAENAAEQCRLEQARLESRRDNLALLLAERLLRIDSPAGEMSAKQ